MFKQLLSLAVAVTLLASAAHADIFFEVGSDTNPITTGSNGTLTFSVTADTAADQAELFDSYAVGFNVSAFGGADLGDISFAIGGASGASGFGAVGFDLGGGSFGVIGARSAGGLDLSVTRDIFTLEFDVTGETLGGGFNIDVATVTDGQNSIDPNVTFQTQDLGATFGANPEATLNYNAVPEPGSAAVVVALAGLMAIRRRRS